MADDEKSCLNIVVYGSAGVGKSTLINSLSGYEVCEVGDSVNMESTGLVRHDICTQDDRKITFYETFTDEKAVLELHGECEDVDLLLYCIDMTNPSFTKYDIDALDVLGKSVWKHCVFVLTKSNVPQAQGNVLSFNNILKNFRNTLISKGVSKRVNIPACVAGHCYGNENERFILYASSSDREMASQEPVDFLTELWLACLERMPTKSQDIFLSFTEERMKASTEQALEANNKYEEVWKQIRKTRPYQRLINEAVPSCLPRNAKNSDLRLTAEHYKRLTTMLKKTQLHNTAVASLRSVAWGVGSLMGLMMTLKIISSGQLPALPIELEPFLYPSLLILQFCLLGLCYICGACSIGLIVFAVKVITQKARTVSLLATTKEALHTLGLTVGTAVGLFALGPFGILIGCIAGTLIGLVFDSDRNQYPQASYIKIISTAVSAGVGYCVGPWPVGFAVGIITGAASGIIITFNYSDSHEYDALHPDICFFGHPFKGRVGRKGLALSCPGLTLTIPPGAVSKDVDIFIRPCLSGPFVLPDGYEIASPPYLIYPHTRFEKAVELSLDHFMHLESEEDCEEMTFISASAKPFYEHWYSNPKYRFSVFYKKGAFEVGSKKAVVKLTHFCIIATARRKRRNEDNSTSDGARITSGCGRNKIKRYDYSVRLYRKLPRDGCVVFSTTLDHKLYIENLERRLKYSEEFHPLPTCSSVQFAEDKISLILPELEDYHLVPDISPCTISRHEVDRPLHDLKKLYLPDYPPRRKITIHQNKKVVASTQIFELKVLGFSEEIKFPIEVLRQPKGSPSSPPDSLPSSPASLRARSPPASPASTSTSPAKDTDEPTLGPEHLDQLAKAVRDAKDSWRAVGEALGFTVQDLDDIEHARGRGENGNCFQELLKRWLDRAPPVHSFPRVKQIADALRAVRKHRTAYELEHSEEFKGL